MRNGYNHRLHRSVGFGKIECYNFRKAFCGSAGTMESLMSAAGAAARIADIIED